jgi:hypothetical protein
MVVLVKILVALIYLTTSLVTLTRAVRGPGHVDVPKPVIECCVVYPQAGSQRVLTLYSITGVKGDFARTYDSERGDSSSGRFSVG